MLDRLFRRAGAGAREKRPTVLVLRHLQHLSPDELFLLEDVIRQLDGTDTRCVCTVTLPVPRASRAAFTEVFDRLRQDGLVHHVNLRPLSPRRLGAVITAEMEARAEPALVDWLWSLTRGWPAAARAVLRTARDQGHVRVVDRHAQLVSGGSGRCPSGIGELVLPVRESDGPVWEAAKAVAVLGPLGEAVPRLTAETLSVTEREARDLLARLADAGVLRYRRSDSAWVYRLPLAGAAVGVSLGPYERRSLARIAVSALWQGTARCADPSYLPEQLAAAGRLVDPERARTELRAAAERLAHQGGDAYDDHRAVRWLRVAADLTTDPVERPRLLLEHAQICLAQGRAEEGLHSLRLVLRAHRDHLRPHQLLDVCFAHMAALYRAGELTALEKIAADGTLQHHGPAGPLERALTRGCALLLLGRWREVREVLAAVRRDDRSGLVEWKAEFLAATAELWLGVADGTDRSRATLPVRHRAGEATAAEVHSRVGELLTLGEIRRAEQLLADTGRSPGQLGLPSRMLIALHRGRPREAMDLARRSAVTGVHTCDAVQSAMYHHAAVQLVCGGRLTRASELLALARARQPMLPHLLDSAQALCDLVHGDAEQARSLLRAAVRRAESDGVVAGTDLLWLRVADAAMHVGRSEVLEECLAKVEVVARRLGTERAEMTRLVLHAAVHNDQGAARAARRLARQRQQPLEESAVLAHLIRYGMGDPAMMRDTYAMLGELDALMPRFWLRSLMRTHGVAVPGRQATAAENERLLAVLVSEGLTNRQIAKILRTSEKSVEGRLSRLFSRTGHGSRVELAMAMLTGRLRW
ncbi:LuxR C-terminal-related transcriptional regulator [Streptomyces fulvoviolaceus]|uniref:LuxR C-terminal-related transcriptional regulator n=1 Tax=Streptomyces fulvoviolaceus TaxID=285535 RepID=UPI0021C17EDE|nr:LuxR C-terminal-related transcriptional regulator [Streptomyces fulvoviolaceus]MCT9075171.1 LuxR C-terminal-related transcriptional regulator [Streptomyces fulvoviolaceus]